MSFDHYPHYAVAAEAILACRPGAKTLSVLEIGVGSGPYLKSLLPDADIHYLNLDSDDGLKLGHGQLDAPAGGFDVVVALDVLQGLPATQRADFLQQLSGLAGHLLVLAAPFESPAVRQAEFEVRNYWGRLFPEPQHRLEKHRIHGLPELAATQAALAAASLDAGTLAHGDVSRWVPLMQAHFAEVRFHPLQGLVDSLQALYRSQFFDKDFQTERPYRHFLIAARTSAWRPGLAQWLAWRSNKAVGSSDSLLDTLARQVTTLALDLHALTLSQQRSEPQQRNRALAEASSLRAQLAELKQASAQTAQILAAREAALANANSVLIHAQGQLDELKYSPLNCLAKGLVWFRKCLHSLSKSLSPLNYKMRLIPVSQIAPGEDKHSFISTGSDPHFLLRPKTGYPMPSGLVRITLRGDIGNRGLMPLLYIDTGEGFHENLTILLGGLARGVTQSYHTLPKRVKALRLDPCMEPSDFRIDAFEITGGSKIWGLLQSLRLVNGEYSPKVRPTLGEYCALLQRGVRRKARERLFGVAANRLYDTWVLNYDNPTSSMLDLMRSRARQLAWQPLISVLMPVYDPPVSMLDEAIWSVRQQAYPHWELCIADDCSTNPQVGEILRKHMAQDARVRVVFRERNGHVCEASNSALALVTGEFVALLDHDDLLPASALFWVAKALEEHPDAALLYSDEDQIDANGNRSDPHFKCDWNYDLLLSQNMVSHLGVYRTARVRQVGGFRPGYEGSQDYDLALRCIEQISPAQIVHIPRVLYHGRRRFDGRSPAGAERKQAGLQALNDHLGRSGIDARAERLDDRPLYRVRYALPAERPLVSIIIPTRNAAVLVRQCIGSILRKTLYPRYEILLIDNGSDDPAALSLFESLRAEGSIRVLRDDRPFNYSALNNAAVRQARGSLLALVNNDIEVITPDWLDEMVSVALQPGIGAVGARLWYPDKTLQHGGVIIGLGHAAGHAHLRLPQGQAGYAARADLMQAYSAVTAACLVVRKSLFEAVGGLNEADLAVAYNDVDFCLRLRELGCRNVWTPFAELFHHESATRGTDDSPQKRARFNSEVEYMHRRWPEMIRNDPAYNPNLALAEGRESFSLSWPPRLPPPLQAIEL